MLRLRDFDAVRGKSMSRDLRVAGPGKPKSNLLLLFLHFFCFFRRFLLLCLFRRPVVQVVSDIMTFAALRILGHHAGRVRGAMTVGTLRDHLVLFLMTECTGKAFMFGIT